MEENLKEVRYDLYCHTCLYEKKRGRSRTMP